MDIQGIGPVKTFAGTAANRIDTLRPVESQRNINREPQALVEKGGNSTEKNKSDQTGQRVKPPANITRNTSEPVDFQAGVIETFIKEMDLLRSRMLAPSEDEDMQQSLDTLA